MGEELIETGMKLKGGEKRQRLACSHGERVPLKNFQQIVLVGGMNLGSITVWLQAMLCWIDKGYNPIVEGKMEDGQIDGRLGTYPFHNQDRNCAMTYTCLGCMGEHSCMDAGSMNHSSCYQYPYGTFHKTGHYHLVR